MRSRFRVGCAALAWPASAGSAADAPGALRASQRPLEPMIDLSAGPPRSN